MLQLVIPIIRAGPRGLSSKCQDRTRLTGKTARDRSQTEA
jgi:hypothetical protein